MKNDVTMSWTDWRGKQHTREFNQTLDIRDFAGTKGYAILLVAANAHLPAVDIEFFLEQMSRQSEEMQSAGRPLTWVTKRRSMFQQPGTVDADPVASDFDGKQERALSLMGEHPNWSVRALHRLLKKNGIERSKEWTRQSRCDLRYSIKMSPMKESEVNLIDS